MVLNNILARLLVLLLPVKNHSSLARHRLAIPPLVSHLVAASIGLRHRRCLLPIRVGAATLLPWKQLLYQLRQLRHCQLQHQVNLARVLQRAKVAVGVVAGATKIKHRQPVHRRKEAAYRLNLQIRGLCLGRKHPVHGVNPVKLAVRIRATHQRQLLQRQQNFQPTIQIRGEHQLRQRPLQAPVPVAGQASVALKVAPNQRQAPGAMPLAGVHRQHHKVINLL